jgi:hypothetical protein
MPPCALSSEKSRAFCPTSGPVSPSSGDRNGPAASVSGTTSGEGAWVAVGVDIGDGTGVIEGCMVGEGGGSRVAAGVAVEV